MTRRLLAPPGGLYLYCALVEAVYVYRVLAFLPALALRYLRDRALIPGHDTNF